MPPFLALIACTSFEGTLSAIEAATAIGLGLNEAGWECETLALEDGKGSSALLPASFDGQLGLSSVVVMGTDSLDARVLSATLLAEVATRARQAGVPCHAIVGRNTLSAFEMRQLDIQYVMAAPGRSSQTVTQGLRKTAAELGQRLAVDFHRASAKVRTTAS